MLGTKVAGISFECAIYNASGPRTGSVEALSKIAQSKAGATLSKSATLKKQDGNPLPRFINKVKMGDDYCAGSINSEGLPNAGIDYYISDEAVSAVAGKPYIVSLSGHTLEDNLEMLTRVYNCPAAKTGGIAAIELNLACPNVPGKPIIAYDFDQMDEVLLQVSKHPNFGTIPLGVKLAPYFDLPHFERAASILVKYSIEFVVSINTVGNALFVDIENECEGIVPKNGLGGLGGGFVKHTALANVRQLRLLLDEKGRPDIDIVGVGGVQSGADAFELLLCGAAAVQTGTCHWIEGPGCFQRIAQELEAIMRKKGYSSIDKFRGTLKKYVKPQRSARTTYTAAAADKRADQGAGTAQELQGMQITVLYSIIFALLAVIAGLAMKVLDLI